MDHLKKNWIGPEIQQPVKQPSLNTDNIPLVNIDVSFEHGFPGSILNNHTYLKWVIYDSENLDRTQPKRVVWHRWQKHQEPNFITKEYKSQMACALFNGLIKNASTYEGFYIALHIIISK